MLSPYMSPVERIWYYSLRTLCGRRIQHLARGFVAGVLEIRQRGRHRAPAQRIVETGVDGFADGQHRGLGLQPDRQRQAVVWNEGRHAITRARVVEDFKGAASLMECWLETGRTHQIRVHMAYAGHGLLGDQTYGGKRRLLEKLFGPQAAELANSFPRQALHAATLGFEHPVTGEELEFESPLPVDMAGLMDALRGP